MMPEFLLRAWLAGLGLALVAGPLGCLVVWRRMAYFGDTLAHSALLGVTLGLLAGIDPILGVAAGGVVIALLIVLLQQQRLLATDTLLGLLAHSSLALGLVTLGLVRSIRIDLMGYLFGDVLAVSWRDLGLIWGGGAVVLGALMLAWQRLVFATLHEEMARAEGLAILPLRLLLMLMVALVVAAAMKVVGILLVTAMLIIPAAAARPLTRTPEAMALLAALLAALAVTAGLWLSWELDTAAGPTMVVLALGLFVAIQTLVLARGVLGWLRR